MPANINLQDSSYIKTTWEQGDLLTEENMNKIENGIEDICNAINTNNETIEAAIGNIRTEITEASGAVGSTLGQRIDDLIILSDIQPQNKPNNEIWVNTSAVTNVSVPTYEEFEALEHSIASEYDAGTPYAVGDLVIHEHELYRCTTDIINGEAWTASHWEKKNLINKIIDNENIFDSKLEQTSNQILNEINNLEESQNEIYDYIEEKIQQLNEDELIPIDTNGYYPLTAVLKSNNSYKCTKIATKNGEGFKISGYVPNSSTTRVYFFADENENYISNYVAAQNATLDNEIIIAPYRAKWLFVNSYLGGSKPTIIKKFTLNEKIEQINEQLNDTNFITFSSSDLWKMGSHTNSIDLTRIKTDFFSPGTLKEVYCTDEYEMIIYRLDSEGNVSYLNVNNSWSTGSSTKYLTNFNFQKYPEYSFLIVLKNAIDSTKKIDISDGENVTFVMTKSGLNEYLINKNREDFNFSTATSWGRSNIIARCNQILNIEWTPLKKIPTVGKYNNKLPYFPEGTKITGIPYSSSRKIGKVVGINVSLHTFMTAINNPRSVMYTKQLNLEIAKPYYGTSCNGLVNYAYDIKEFMLSPEQKKYLNMIEIPIYAMQAGDWLHSSNQHHEMMIVSLEKDKYGRITKIKFSQSSMPLNGRSSYSLQHFQQEVLERDGYKIYRYPKADEVSYTPSEYVKGYADEVLPEIIYPDIMCEYGDKAVIAEQNGANTSKTNITINVLNSEGYERIVVKRNDQTILSTNELEDFTLQGSELAPGEYEITMSGENSESSTTFTIIETSGCSWDENTHIVNFPSSNGEPYFVWAYKFNQTPGSNQNTPNRGRPLTEQEISARQANITDLFEEYPDENFNSVKVLFKHKDGDAMWFSSWDDTWVSDYTE